MNSILTLVEKHCVGETNVIYERYVFNNRIQETHETVDTYATAPRSLAKSCDFGSLKDDLIRDRIVCGIRDNAMRKRLLQESSLTLNKCMDICRAVESTVTKIFLTRLPSQTTSSRWQVDKEAIGLSIVQQFSHLCVARPYQISVNSIFKYIHTTSINTIIWQFVPFIYHPL